MSDSTAGGERTERDPATIWTPAEARGRAGVRPRLEQRRILVVGAGAQPCEEPDAPEGNGRAISLLCAREGARVGCADKVKAAAQETQRRIEAEGGRAVSFTADVTEEQACEELVQRAHAELGGLDGIVLNVGSGFGRGLAGTDAKAWDLTFAVNLRSHFLVTRAAMPLLAPGAALVFISSTAGLRPGTGIPAYDASKAGIAGLCRHVAMEGSRRGIRANVVVPGLIDTPLGRAANRGRKSRAATPIPLGRQGTGWEVAYATAFLLSNESSYITGQTLTVDGGLSNLR
jgi:NAD(P)-dependent dehydrogenase (short-subunit alcohol dehydrogenase family)